MYGKLKIYSIQCFKECLFFVFFLFLFLFLLLANNTLHAMFYIYIGYWNTLQYKYILLFSIRKTTSCASDFKRYLFTLHQIIYFPISVLSRHRFISWSSPPPLLFNWPRVRLYLNVLQRLKQRHDQESDNLFLMLRWRSDNNLCFAVVLKQKKKKETYILLFLSTLREWIFPWALSRKLITWAKCETLTILAKAPRKIDKYFPFAKSNLRKNSFTQLRDFVTFLFFVFIEK